MLRQSAFEDLGRAEEQAILAVNVLGVTNGIHTPSWVGHAMGETLAKGVRADLDNLDAQGSGGRFWERLDQIPTDELWETQAFLEPAAALALSPDESKVVVTGSSLDDSGDTR